MQSKHGSSSIISRISVSDFYRRSVPIPETHEARAIPIPIGTTMTSANSRHFVLRRLQFDLASRE